MKEDTLVCPFCQKCSQSKLTTHISDDSVVRCNYCDNQFKMAEARAAMPQRHERHGSGPRASRLLRSRSSHQLSNASTQVMVGSAKRSPRRLRYESITEIESETSERNDLAVAAFVTSLAAFLFAGCLSPISLVFSIVALEKQPRGMAAAALVLSLIGLVPMTVVALPMFARAMQDSADMHIALPSLRVAEEDASEQPAGAAGTQSPSVDLPIDKTDASNQQEIARGMSNQQPPAKPPAVRFSEVKQEQKPLGGIGLYLTAENISGEPVYRFVATVQFIDKNDEVVAQDQIRESFQKPIAPGERRSLVFSPGLRSELRNIVPDTCRGSATAVSVN